MKMQLFTAQVVSGNLVPDDDMLLPEGLRVLALAIDHDLDGNLDDAEEAAWLEMLWEARRGEGLGTPEDPFP
jgi:hypothetical protein